MFMRGDFDVNSVQRNTDALKEAFKQTMLNQENTFRKQVHELHRLHRVQITLMKDLGCKEFGRYNSCKESTQSSPMPHTNSISYEPPLKEPRFSSISMVCSVPPINQELFEGCQGMHDNLQQMPFDLQVPANQYISCADNDFLDKRNDSNHVKRTLESHVNNVSDAMDLTLSLSLGADSKRREGTKRSWLDKETHSYPIFVIDLEDSTERISRGNAKQEPSLGCTGLTTSTGGKDGSQMSVLSNLTIPRIVEKDTSHELAVSRFLVDNGECFQEQHSSNQESGESQADIPCKYMYIRKQKVFTSYDARHLDLNKVQLDDLPCSFSDPQVAYLSAASSIGSLPEMVARDKLSGGGEADLSPASLKSISRPPMYRSEYLGGCSSDPSNRDKFTSELQKGLLNDLNHTCVATRQVSSEKSEVEGPAYSCSGQSHDKCAGSCKSCCIVDNVSSSIKTLQPHIELGNSSTPAVEQHQKSSGNSENECINRKEGLAKVDVLIQRAAESLVHISLENSASFQDHTTRSGSNEIENNKSEQPQNSSDSFELLTLKLKDSSSEDYCVSSKPFEVNDTDKRDFGIKLKRGRRMKDFQREILPGLASLTRHEILEDINILEGALKSKEYRKNRARMADGESWCLQLRSRRKRINYTQRRNFS